MTPYPTCETCPHFAAYEEGIQDGECREDSPKLFSPEKILRGEWPHVKRSEWCGKHPQRDPMLQVLKTIATMIKAINQKY